MPKALIFDCFGVLVGPSLEYLKSLAKNENDSQEISDINLQADLGFISKNELLSGLSNILDIPEPDIWDIMKKKRLIMKNTVSFLNQKKHDGLKIGLLSNVAQDTLETIFMKEELKEMFDVMVLSYDTHLVKPDPEIYKLMAEKLGCPPGECVMIDDSSENIVGAKKSGMEGIVFSSVEQLKKELKLLGL